MEYGATFQFDLVNKLRKNSTARKESWHYMKEDLQKNWTPVPGYEPDPVTRVTGFVYELKVSLTMQQIPGMQQIPSKNPRWSSLFPRSSAGTWKTVKTGIMLKLWK